MTVHDLIVTHLDKHPDPFLISDYGVNRSMPHGSFYSMKLKNRKDSPVVFIRLYHMDWNWADYDVNIKNGSIEIVVINASINKTDFYIIDDATSLTEEQFFQLTLTTDTGITDYSTLQRVLIEFDKYESKLENTR